MIVIICARYSGASAVTAALGIPALSAQGKVGGALKSGPTALPRLKAGQHRALLCTGAAVCMALVWPR